MSNDTLINDIRLIKDFKKISFSGYEKGLVIKKLTSSILSSQLEESCNWSAELVCAGHFKDLWEIIIMYMSKYIHIGSPKLPIYIAMRIDNFKKIVKNGYQDNELDLRNNKNIRHLFGEIIIVLCYSLKKHSINLIKIDKESDFLLNNMKCKFKAPNIKFLDNIFKEGDPQELFIGLNELAYHLKEKNSYNCSYWVEWIIEFDLLCKKNKKPCDCERRGWVQVDSQFQKDSIWIVWQIIKREAENKSEIIKKTIKSLLDIYSLRFTTGIKKRRKYIIYNAINILCENINEKVSVISDTKKLNSILEKVDLIYKEVKKK